MTVRTFGAVRRHMVLQLQERTRGCAAEKPIASGILHHAMTLHEQIAIAIAIAQDEKTAQRRGSDFG